MGSQLHFLSRLLVGAFLTQFFLLRLSGQTDLAEALESDLLEWEATPVDAWRAVESPSAKVGGNMVSYFGGGSDDRYRGTLSATVSGPATISFWWKAEVGDSDDEPSVAINGVTVLTREEDSDPVWEQVRIGFPSGDHTLSFSVEYWDFFLDGVEVQEGEVLPVALAFGDTDGVLVQEGADWEVVEDTGPTGQPALVSTFDNEDTGELSYATIVLVLSKDSRLVARYWSRQEGEGKFRSPSGGTVTEIDDWKRTASPFGPHGKLVFHHSKIGLSESKFELSALEFEPVSIVDALDMGLRTGDEAVEISIADERGNLFVGDGHDLAGNGSLIFTGGIGGNSAKISRSYDGPGLLTFSWWIWANQGESLTVRADGEQLLRRTSRSYSEFSQEVILLPDAADQELEWTLRFQGNPWNPMYLDDIHYSTVADSSLNSALGLTAGSELFTTAPDRGSDLARQAVTAQSEVTHDGASAVAIVPPLDNGEPTQDTQRRTITLSVSGPVVVSFWSKSELPLEASFACFVSGKRITQIDGSTDWTEATVAVPPGAHTVRWELITNDVVFSDGDAAWLDDVVVSVPSGAVPAALDAESLTWSEGRAQVFKGDLAGANGGDAVILFGNRTTSPGPWVEVKTSGAGVLRYSARGSLGRGGGSGGGIDVNGVAFGGTAVGPEWAPHLLSLPPGENTVRFRVFQGNEVWLDNFSFTRATMVSPAEALDAPELVFEEGPRSQGAGEWVALGNLSTSSDGEDSLALSEFPFKGRTADVRTTVEGPARISFVHAGQLEVLIGDESPERRFFATPIHGWTTKRISIPAGAHRIGWIARGNRITAGLDAVSVISQQDDRVSAALDSDMHWVGFGDIPWEATTAAEETFDGVDALVANGRALSSGYSTNLQTTVEGPAMVRFAAKAIGPYSIFDDGAFSVGLQPANGNGGGTEPIRISFGGWREYDLPVPRGQWTLSFAGRVQFDSTLYLDAVSVIPLEIGIAEATGAPGLVWRSGGAAPWSGQPSSRGPNSVEAVSGIVAKGETSWIETVIEGPATFQFSWRGFNFGQFDRLRFQIDGEERSELGNTFGALSEPWTVGSGTHSLRWELTQDSSTNASAVLNGFTIVSDYDQWASARAIPSALAGPNADADFDGITNLFEFVLGTDPLVYGDNALVIEESLSGVDVSYLALPRIETGKAVSLQVSTDMIDWLEVPTEEYYDGQAQPFSRLRAEIESTSREIFVRLAISDKP